MTDYPQAWIEIGAHAIYDADPESEHPDEELEGCRTIAEMILDAVVPDIRAEGAATERERIRRAVAANTTTLQRPGTGRNIRECVEVILVRDLADLLEGVR